MTSGGFDVGPPIRIEDDIWTPKLNARGKKNEAVRLFREAAQARYARSVNMDKYPDARLLLPVWPATGFPPHI